MDTLHVPLRLMNGTARAYRDVDVFVANTSDTFTNSLVMDAADCEGICVTHRYSTWFGWSAS